MRNVHIPVSILMLLVLWISQSAHAEVYKCTQDGKLIYSDHPCGPNTQTLQTDELPLTSMSPPVRNPQTEALIRQHDQQQAAQLQRRREEDQQWLADYAKQKEPTKADAAAPQADQSTWIYTPIGRDIRNKRVHSTRSRHTPPQSDAPGARPPFLDLPQGTAPPLPGVRDIPSKPRTAGSSANPAKDKDPHP